RSPTPRGVSCGLFRPGLTSITTRCVFSSDLARWVEAQPHALLVIGLCREKPLSGFCCDLLARSALARCLLRHDRLPVVFVVSRHDLCGDAATLGYGEPVLHRPRADGPRPFPISRGGPRRGGADRWPDS